MKARLDRQIEELLNQLAERDMPPVQTLTPDKARETRNPVLIEFGGSPEAVQDVKNLNIPGPAGEITLRVYTPEGSAPFPVLVYFHGGGWVIGNLETHDSLCRLLAKRASCVTVSVEYRLAPGNKYPAAAEDCYAATKWVAENADRISVDPSRIAVAGDSAGGNLAAVVSLMARDKGAPPLTHQVLIYPATDLTSLETNSYREHGEGYILTKESMEYYRGHYLRRDEDAQQPYASPLRAYDLKGLPPALVITAECDVLTDESEAYAKRLKQAGVPTNYSCYKGMIHPFVSFIGVLDKAREAVGEIADALRKAFAK